MSNIPTVSVKRGRILPSDIETVKTSEFQNRRKLRLLQVREQSNDIARIVRERAAREKLKQLKNLSDNKKELNFKQREKLVRVLENVYSDNVQKVGAGHETAEQTKNQEILEEQNKPSDLSKERGRTAITLEKEKQQRELDAKKIALDKRLAARVLANNRNKSLPKRTISTAVSTDSKRNVEVQHNIYNINCSTQTDQQPLNNNNIEKKDMETQYVPEMDVKKSCDAEITKNDLVRDLFAVSDDLPSDLRGNIYPAPQSKPPPLNIVTNFLGNRNTRHVDSTHSLTSMAKKTLCESRDLIIRANHSPAPKLNKSICRVLDDSANPVPSWEAVGNVCGFCPNERVRSKSLLSHVPAKSSKQSNASVKHSPKRSCKNLSSDKTVGLKASPKPRKDIVTHYDHTTKSIINIPKAKAVVEKYDDDKQMNAYDMAVKESKELIEANSRNKCEKHKDRGKCAEQKEKTIHDYEDMMKVLKDYTKDSQLTRPIVVERSTSPILKHKKRKIKKSSESTIDSNGTSVSDDDNEILMAAINSISDAESLLHYIKKKHPKKHVKRKVTMESDESKSPSRVIIVNRKVKDTKKMVDTATNMNEKDIAKPVVKKTMSKKKSLRNSGRTADKHQVSQEFLMQTSEMLIRQWDYDAADTNAIPWWVKESCSTQVGQDKKNSILVNNSITTQMDTKHNIQFEWDVGEVDRGDTKIPMKKLSKQVIKDVNSQMSNATSNEGFETAHSDTSIGSLTISRDNNSKEIHCKKNESNDNVDKDSLKSGGFVKVLDESGKEAGKFFIGNCRRLDEKFEVVVQLRRKSDNGCKNLETKEKLYVPETPPVKTMSSDFSSTSTVYMSPPDVILPKFLRKSTICNDMAEQTTAKILVDKNVGNNRKHNKKECSRKNVTENVVRLSKESDEKLKKEPNRTEFAQPSISKQQNNITNIQRSETLDSLKKHKSGEIEPELNPEVKAYINKLLGMSKKDLKKFNLSTTSIETPGSSIVGIPSNIVLQQKKKNKNFLFKNETLIEGLTNDNNYVVASILVQKGLNTLEDNNELSSSRSVGDGGDKKRDKKKKYCKNKKLNRHKIKSVNISKNLYKYFNTVDDEETNKLVYFRRKDSSSCNQYADNKEVQRNKTFPQINKNYKVAPKQKNTVKKTCSKVRVPNSPRKTVSAPDIKITNKSCKNAPNTPNNVNNTKNIKAPATTITTTTKPASPIIRTSPPVKEASYKIIEKPQSVTLATQTSELQSVTSEFNPSTEMKLINIERISDMTEKCTERLSNLAKVLEEVRKSKNSLYAQLSGEDISLTSFDKANKSKELDNNKVGLQLKEPDCTKNDKTSFVPLLMNIPKPKVGQKLVHQIDNEKLITIEPKMKTRPPPAINRVHHIHNNIDSHPAHELSTVLEVDTPKSANSIKIINRKSPVKLQFDANGNESSRINEKENIPNNNPNLLASNESLRRFPMMDLKKFNEIMLQPFITFEEYVKKCNITIPKDMSTFDEATMNKHKEIINDELSLNSDGTLPDIVSELLKRNIIDEPFNFDNNTLTQTSSLSSDSTISTLALSKMYKKRRQSGGNKNLSPPKKKSDKVSKSSLEFESVLAELGIHWASSTLKKTKEAFALQSSSSTSLSSMSREISQVNKEKHKQKLYKDIANFMNDTSDINSLASDVFSSHESSMSSYIKNKSKHSVQQQTSNVYSHPMSVMGFLTQELADKITFTKISDKNDSEEHFTSLHTNITRNSSIDKSNFKLNEAEDRLSQRRTSTPVQLFKSPNYHYSSTSSENSNCLFSNADDISSVKGTSHSKNHSQSEKDDLVIPNESLNVRKFKNIAKYDSS